MAVQLDCDRLVMGRWENPIPRVGNVDSNSLRRIFTSISEWSATAGGSGYPCTMLYGSVNPTAVTGVNGDFYLNSSSLTLFGPKAAGVWPSGVSLVGAAGAAGAVGAVGAAGAVGATGATGPQGGTFDIEGGAPSSVYGGTTLIDCGGV